MGVSFCPYTWAPTYDHAHNYAPPRAPTRPRAHPLQTTRNSWPPTQTRGGSHNTLGDHNATPERPQHNMGTQKPRGCPKACRVALHGVWYAHPTQTRGHWWLPTLMRDGRPNSRMWMPKTACYGRPQNFGAAHNSTSWMSIILAH